MSWPTRGMVAPDFSHSTLRSSSGDGGSGSSSFFTHAGVPWAFRRLSQGRLLGVCCFSGCWAAGGGWGGSQDGETEQEQMGGGEKDADVSQNTEEGTRKVQGEGERPWHPQTAQGLRSPPLGQGLGEACRGGQLEAAACSAPLVWLFPSLSSCPGPSALPTRADRGPGADPPTCPAPPASRPALGEG